MRRWKKLLLSASLPWLRLVRFADPVQKRRAVFLPVFSPWLHHVSFVSASVPLFYSLPGHLVDLVV